MFYLEKTLCITIYRVLVFSRFPNENKVVKKMHTQTQTQTHIHTDIPPKGRARDKNAKSKKSEVRRE
jgi:hypothetical protein